MRADARNALASLAAGRIYAFFSDRGACYAQPRFVLSSGIDSIDGNDGDAIANLDCILRQLKEWHEDYTAGKVDALYGDVADRVYDALSAFNSWRADVLNFGTNSWIKKTKEGEALYVYLLHVDFMLTRRRPAVHDADREELSRLKRDLRYATGDDRREIQERIDELEVKQ